MLADVTLQVKSERKGRLPDRPCEGCRRAHGKCPKRRVRIVEHVPVGGEEETRGVGQRSMKQSGRRLNREGRECPEDGGA